MSKKKVIVNYIYSSAYQLFLIIVPFITAPYLARVLTEDPVGINSYVSSIVQIFSLVGLLGLNSYSTREIAYVRDDNERMSKTLSELVILRMIFFVITTIIYLLYASTSEYRIYFYIQIISVMSAFIDISWFYGGIEEFKVTVFRSFVVKVFNISSIFLFIKSPDDLGLFMVISSIYALIGNILLYRGVKKRIGKFTFKDLHPARHIGPSIRLFLPQVASLIYLQVDKVMIGQLTDEISQVGFYDQAERIVKMPLALITALSSVLLPRLSNEFRNNNTENVKRYVLSAMRFSLLFAIPLMFGLMAIAPTMIPWFLGDGYNGVIMIMVVLSPIVLFISISSVSGSQYLTAVNKTNVLTISYVVSALINLCINYLLIPKFGAVGAAIGTVAAEFCACFYQLMSMRSVVSIRNLAKVSIKYIISGVVMFAICTFVGQYFGIRILSTVLQIGIGIIIYFLVLFILRDSFYLNTIKEGFTFIKHKFFRNK
ncbi:flippase [Breznakia sp. OttesenSCG-928-G09]|nr:flippase [Breznakia sp. OttesenSCG-928-G09]